MKRTMWMLLDDRKGSVSQARGVAKALGDKITIIEKNITYNKLACLPNWFKGRSLIGVNTKKSDDLSAPYPDVILSTSRRTVALARHIRKQSGNNSKIVQLMYPSGGVGICDMEKIIIPSHDALKKRQNKKAFVITGAPTTITKEVLNEAKEKWDPVFSQYPRPWISASCKCKKIGRKNLRNKCQTRRICIYYLISPHRKRSRTNNNE